MPSEETSQDKLQKQYASVLPERLKSIKKQYRSLRLDGWQRPQLQELHHMLHSLAGSAGTFGMHSLSNKAQSIDKAIQTYLSTGDLPEDTHWKRIDDELNRLLQLADQYLARGQIQSNSLIKNDIRNHSHRIYVVEDDPEQANYLKIILQEHGYHVRIFESQTAFQAAFGSAECECPGAIILDMILPEGDSGGLELLKDIKQNTHCKPPVVVTSIRDDFDARLHVYHSGAARYFHKPVEPNALLAQIDELTHRKIADPYKVLLVDDDPIVLEIQANALAAAGMNVKTSAEPRTTLELLDEYQPDVLVLDVFMPEFRGPDLAAIIREREAYLQLPIIFLSGETDIDEHLKALDLGGDDFLVKPVRPEHLVSAVTARAKRTRQMHNTLQNRYKATSYEREREHLALNQHALVSVTDQRGQIISANDKFCKVSGYTLQELLGHNHRIVKSGEHPPSFYQEIWQTISKGQIWQGEICNRAKDGSLYWVDSTITPFMNDQGRPYQYVSIRTDITEKKRAEQEIQSVKELLRMGQFYADIGTWEWNIVTGDLYWTERIAPLFGHAEGELETSYENFISAVHPDDRDKLQEAVRACIEEDAPYNIEHRVAWPDGTVRWLLERGAVQRDDQGKPIKMVGVVQDINDRKRAELSLKERERQLVEAQHLASIGNWQANLVTGELYWSDEIYRIFGYAPREITPSVAVFHSAVHPDDLEIVRESEKIAEETGKHDVVHRIIRPDGSIRYVHELAQMQLDEHGQPHTLSGTVQDVTELKEAEQDLLIFRRIFDSTEEGIGVADSKGHLIYTNPAHDRIHGYEIGECIGLHFNTFFSKETQSWANDAIMSALETKGAWHNKLPIVQKDGTEIITLANVGFISDEKGDIQYLFNMMSDYGPELKRQNQLEQAKNEAERANKAKSEFLSSMSHELRTPLNAILGFGQVLKYDDRLPIDQVENVDEILTGGNHLLELINVVLDLAKIEAGRIELKTVQLELCSVLKECLSLIRPQAEKRRIEVIHDGMPGLSVTADRTRLKQVLLNLLSNAVKYNRESGKIEVDVKKPKSGRLQICITDTGPGIPQDKLPELFQPFNRMGFTNSDVEGTGIGLTITKEIMEMMNGTINVESQPGVGTSFCLDLPCENTQDEMPENLLVTSQAKDAFPDIIDTKTVLYIDDDPERLARFETMIVSENGLSALMADSPEKGIEFAFEKHPSLIFVNLNLPRINGFQLLEIFNTDDTLQKTPVIAVQVDPQSNDLDRIKHAGFEEHVTAPFESDTLLVKINQILKINHE